MDSDSDDGPPPLVPLDAAPAPAARPAARAAPPRPRDGRPPVPVTLITGALGAGKTTLVTHILTCAHGLRLAVVLNEAAADAGIEDALVAAAADAAGARAVAGDAWIKLANGCLCCSVKSDFLSALETLAARDDGGDVDAILVETSGLADPGPAAAALWADAHLDAAARLDGVVAVVDAARFRGALADARADGAVREVALQVAHADVVVVNKIDAAGESETAAVEAAVQALNPGAALVRAVRSAVDPRRLLGRRTVDADTAAAAAAAAANAAAAAAAVGAPPPGSTPHAHDAGITTHAWTAPGGRVGEPELRAWLERVLWSDRAPPAMDVYRFKALVPLASADASTTRRAVVQAVADTYEVVDCGAWVGDPVAARAVAIGRFLDVQGAFVWRYFHGPADDGAAPSPPPKAAPPPPPPPPAAPPAPKLLPVAPTTVAAVRAAARADGTDAALAASGEPLDELAARRWLHACGGDVEAATTSLRSHAAWRAATAPGGTVPAAAFAAVAARPKICLQGLDARGRPVLLLRAALHARGDAAANAALVCYALDAAERLTRRHPHPLNPEHRILVLFDLARVRPSNCDVRALASIFDVLKRHYPERLDALLFLNAPPLFGSLYALVSPMVVDGVRRKIAFVPRGAAGAKRVLTPLLPPAVWPASLGGDAPEVPVQAAVAAAAAPRGFLGFPAAAARGSAAALLRLAPRPLARTAAVLAAVAALAVAALASALRWAVWGQALGAGGGKGMAARARRAAPPPADDCCKKPAARSQAEAEAGAGADAADAEPAWMAFGPPPAAGLDLLWAGGLAPLADA